MRTKLIVQAKADCMMDVLQFLEDYLRKWNCSAKVQNQIELAVEEIFVNIVNYGYEKQEGNVEILLEMVEKEKKFRIIFIDTGIPYDPSARKDPDIRKHAEERESGGLGIFIVKRIIDKMEYHYIDNKNVLILEKSLKN